MITKNRISGRVVYTSNTKNVVGDGGSGSSLPRYVKFDKDKIVNLTERGLLFKTYLIRCVEKKGNLYYWFFEYNNSGTWEIWAGTSDITSDDPLRITSYSATRLLEPGLTGSDDSKGGADPSVIYDEESDIWHMWFETFITTTFPTIGYATCPGASDPLVASNWTKQATVMRIGGDWRDNALHHPSVVKHDGLFYMMFCGRKSGGSGHKIGVAVSKDGKYFHEHLNNPVIDPITIPNSYDSVQVRTSKPFKIADMWYMIYWGNNGTVDRNLLAQSPDLINWKKTGVVVFDADASNGYPQALAVHHDTESNTILMMSKAKTSDSAGYHHQFNVYRADIFQDAARINEWGGEYEYGDKVTERLGSLGADTVYFAKITTGATGGYLHGYGFSHGRMTAATGLKIALYADNAGNPGNLITNSAVTIAGPNSVYDPYFVGWSKSQIIANHPTLQANTTYWVAFLANGAWIGPKDSVRIGPLASSWGYQAARPYAGGFPATATIAGRQTQDLGVYLMVGSAPNVWAAALNDAPEFLAVDGHFATRVSAVANADGEMKWTWASEKLYLYSIGEPSRKYFSLGVTARMS